MKKTLLIGLMTITAALIVMQTGGFVKASPASAAPSAASKMSSRLALRPYVSPEQAIARDLPSLIPDPILRGAWLRLYQQQDPIQLWDSSTVTGRDLAQYLFDHNIPVVWDTGNVCSNSSCSIKHCHADGCVYDEGKPGVEPIYILPAYLTDPSGLVGTLAHEIFHRTQPFGAVPTTRFEEYWAFVIAAHLSTTDALVFSGYDSLYPGDLTLWINENRIGAYLALPEYPASVIPLLQRGWKGAKRQTPPTPSSHPWSTK